ncbi:Uncharacterised protein [Bifidobacterium longum subsp. infantis]|uniref:Uncharacterized protein n=1 Tax=Bifidobacterium longum subsp. infantis TaxID=1682 RepID=A0A564VXJ8_BIFLI|nr:Uncharacterised protein [Bifidobacterium longum subsp. infantis]
MFDQQDGDAETVTNRVDAVQQILSFGGVHAGGWFIKQQQFHAGGQCTRDFELALLAVGQVGRLGGGQSLEVEDAQQVDGLLMHLVLLLPEARGTEDGATHTVGERLVEGDEHVLLNGELLEQSDVLEGTGDTGTHDLIGLLAVHPDAIQPEFAFSGLVHAGQQVEHRGLASAIRADQTDEFTLVDGHVEVGYGLQTTEGDAEMLGFEDGLTVIAHGQASFVAVSGVSGSASALAADFAPLPAVPRSSMRLTSLGSENSHEPKMPCGRKIMTSTSTTE